MPSAPGRDEASPRQLPAPPSPIRCWASRKYPLWKGTASSICKTRGQLPIQQRGVQAASPPGHQVGPPRCPAASKCLLPLLQSQLTGAFDSPMCRHSGTHRPPEASLEKTIHVLQGGQSPQCMGGSTRSAPRGQSSSVPDIREGGTFRRNWGTCFIPALWLPQ